MPLPEGTRLGRYEIRSQLGAGGMGEVYLARDAELGRAVAIKILPADVAADQQRMNRFVQEARAASALSHPNILAIHEIGWDGATRFIAMEYVEGETLRQRMARAPMKLGDVLDVVIQSASALSAAHAAGVVHRDVKPDNIMLRADGYVKVLDFGLAKLTRDDDRRAPDTEAPTRALVNTSPGTVMGTFAYMSPEQARGQETDARADIWSLGVVLYEMTTGRQPFAGETSSHVIVSILEREPPPLARYVDGAPEALEWIVAKALTKDRDERYQTAREMLNDLRRLKQRLEFAAEMERSVAPGASGSGMGLAPDARADLSRASGFASETRTSLIDPPRRTADENACATASPAKSRSPQLLFAIIALVVVAVTAVPAYRYASRRWFSAAPRAAFRSMKLTRLTNTGRASIASISPDGKYVVHASEEGERQSLWIRQVATASNVQIIPPAEVHYQGLTFSPDGDYVYYVAHERNSSLSVVYRVATLGDTPKQIAEDADSPATVSPDGKRLAFIRNYPGRTETALVVVAVDGTAAERTLATRRGSQRFAWGDSLGPAWSPDGKLIACPAANVESGVERQTVVAVGVEDGAETPVAAARNWSAVGQVAWLAGGEGLVFVAAEQAGAPSQVWRVSYPAGEARRITNDLNNYTGVSATADSNALVAVQAEVESRVWIAPGGDARSARQVTNGKNDGSLGLTWTPDGAVVYTSDDGGDSNLWSVDAAGAQKKQLTSDARLSGNPSASPDGRYVFFVSNRSGTPHVWRMNADASSPRQLTAGVGGNQPFVSPDGKWIIYFNFECNCLWKMSSEGGDAARLTDKLSGRGAISPDGKLVACTYRGDAAASYYSLGILSSEDGRLVKALDFPRTTAIGNLRWTPDGRAVAYVDTRAGVSNVWAQPTDGGAPRQLTDFKTDHIFFFDFSRDGRQLAVARGTRASDVVLINNLD